MEVSITRNKQACRLLKCFFITLLEPRLYILFFGNKFHPILGGLRSFPKFGRKKFGGIEFHRHFAHFDGFSDLTGCGLMFEIGIDNEKTIWTDG
jgi:hypothetical protein